MISIRRTYEGIECLCYSPKFKCQLSEDNILYGMPDEEDPMLGVDIAIPMSPYVNSKPRALAGSIDSSLVVISSGASKVGCKPGKSVNEIDFDDLEYVLKNRYRETLSKNFIDQVVRVVKVLMDFDKSTKTAAAHQLIYDYFDRHPYDLSLISPSINHALVAVLSSLVDEAGDGVLSARDITFCRDLMDSLNNGAPVKKNNVFCPESVVGLLAEKGGAFVVEGSEDLRNMLAWLLAKCASCFSTVSAFNSVFNGSYSNKKSILSGLVSAATN